MKRAGRCCAIRIPHAKPLVPNGTSSPELPFASWLHASLPIHAFAISLAVGTDGRKSNPTQLTGPTMVLYQGYIRSVTLVA
jgi:hypothetical protein